MPHDVRDDVVDYVHKWSSKTDVAKSRIVGWIGIGCSKFHGWQQRYGKINEHNHWISRDHWLEDWEKQAIVDFHHAHPDEGYRRLTYMMLDAGTVAASASTVYRVLKNAGCLQPRWAEPSSKGKGFHQPDKPHQHWHIDMCYINICGTFCYLAIIIDGYSRYIVHWSLGESMTEADVEIVLQEAKEKFPDARARIISDNGPQFVARDFKEMVRISGMTHVRTSPYYPQSNGKAERVIGTTKREAIRPKTPLNIDDARHTIAAFIGRYCDERLHSAIGYITPKIKLLGREAEIFAERDRKLNEARERRKARRTAKAQLTTVGPSANKCSTGETEAGSAGMHPARDNRPGVRHSNTPGEAETPSPKKKVAILHA